MLCRLFSPFPIGGHQDVSITYLFVYFTIFKCCFSEHNTSLLTCMIMYTEWIPKNGIFGWRECAFTILIDTAVVPSPQVVPVLSAVSSRVREWLFKYFIFTNVARETSWYSIDILISISIIMSIFSYVYTPFVFTFCELPFYFLGSFVFWFERAVHIIKKISSLSDLYVANISPSLSFVFVSGNVFFLLPLRSLKIFVFSFVSAFPCN